MLDFVTWLSKNKDRLRVEYDSIFVIVDRLTKMVHYQLILQTLDAEPFTKRSIDAVMRYYGPQDSIVPGEGF